MTESNKSHKGIDVSHWQGKINWERVKKHGIEFAIIRCCAGTSEDKRFKENADACTKVGIPFGVYVYSYATNTSQARLEAKKVCSLIKDYKLSCGIWFDMEDGDGYKARHSFRFTSDNVTSICKAFLDEAKSLGMENCGVYASLSWFKRYIDEETLKCPVWVAQWSEKLSYDKQATMWQYSSTERVDGINGNVDGNIAYFDVDKQTPPQKSVWEYTSNDLAWELAHRKLIDDSAFWIAKLDSDNDTLSLVRNTVAYFQQKNV